MNEITTIARLLFGALAKKFNLYAVCIGYVTGKNRGEFMFIILKYYMTSTNIINSIKYLPPNHNVRYLLENDNIKHLLPNDNMKCLPPKNKYLLAR